VRVLAIERRVRRRYLFKKRWKRAAVAILDGLGMVGVSLRRIFKRLPPFNPQRILVVRIDSLGDAVLTLPALEALKTRFPNAQIDFLVSPAVHELYAFLFPNSKIILFERNWLSGMGSFGGIWGESFSIVKQLKASHYDLGIDFRGDLRTILLMSLADIPHRWGREGTGGGFLLTHKLPNPFQKHEILENVELVSENGSCLKVEFPPLPHAVRRSEIVQGKKVIIHVGAGYPSKRWSAENFVEVAKRIREKRLGTPIFIGTEEEGSLLGPYRNRIGAGMVDLTGKTSFKELLELLADTDLYIGNDSGPAHLAALLDRKIVLIFSGTNDFKRWAPWSSKLQLVHHPVPCSPCEERVCPLERQICLEEIPVEEVFCAVEKALSN